MKILLKNGLIVDGEGNKAFQGSIIIENDKISKISKEEIKDFKGEIIDCSGLVIAPGFIDGHSHSDWTVLGRNKIMFAKPHLLQGITTIVAGNCGFSASGFDPDCKNLLEVGGDSFVMDKEVVIPSFNKWVAKLDDNVPLNTLSLIGHNSVRGSIAGLTDRPLTKEEHQKMMVLLEKGLKEGAAGISVGLMYRPGIFSSKEELIEIGKLCKKYNKVMSFHNRANSAVSMGYDKLLGRSHLLRALDEVVEIGEKTGCKIHNSHLIFVGKKSWTNVDEALALLEGLEKKGVPTTYDLYAFECGASTITVILPKWYQALPFEKRNSFKVKSRLAIEILITKKLLGFGYEDIQIAYCGQQQKDIIGKNIKQIAKERKQSCLKTYLEICAKNDFRGRIYLHKYYNEEIIKRLAKHHMSTFMTDAWYETQGIQNPSVYNCYLKFLRLAREEQILPLEGTIYKMSGKIAEIYGIENRGKLKEGNFADITIFNYNEVKENSILEEPANVIKHIFINGKQVLKDYEVQPCFGNTGKAVKLK